MRSALVGLDDAALDLERIPFRCCGRSVIAPLVISEPTQRCSFGRIAPFLRVRPNELRGTVPQQMPCGAQQKVTVVRICKRRIHIGQPIQRGQGRQRLLENQVGTGFLPVGRSTMQVGHDLAAKVVQVVHCERTGIVEELSFDLRRADPARVRGEIVVVGIQIAFAIAEDHVQEWPEIAPDAAHVGLPSAIECNRKQQPLLRVLSDNRQAEGMKRPDLVDSVSDQWRRLHLERRHAQTHSASSRGIAAGFRSSASSVPGSARA